MCVFFLGTWHCFLPESLCGLFGLVYQRCATEPSIKPHGIAHGHQNNMTYCTVNIYTVYIYILYNMFVCGYEHVLTFCFIV